uniref:NodB homology domain-containing protein n=1 Tax=Glossina brevipalpis TaxID=37001 RepID=A0A1A9W0I4_9MUSC
MYSHELQTCDWPRNVGCDVSDSVAREQKQGRVQGQQQPQQKQQPQQQTNVPSRIRFGSAFTSPQGQQQPLKATAPPPQYHRQPSQVIQAQVHNIPPPPQLKVSPNPVITSRGQPKHILEAQEEIAKLYADALETLPPVEEEETDRQQRVYRGQPSTVSQVQRDRDGIIHQPNINVIPNHDKFSSYSSYGNQYRDLDYQQPQQQQQTHQQQQQQQQQRYQSPQQPLRNSQSQQSTYRPLDIFTTPSPPLRESYKSQAKPERTSNYGSNQQGLIYNNDYDEDLIAQIEQDNSYDQPTRTASRNPQISIQTLRSGSSSTVRAVLERDERNYYNTLTTPVPTLPNDAEEPAYIYEADYRDSADYYYTNKKGSVKYTGKLKPLTLQDSYDVIGVRLQNIQDFETKSRTATKTTTSTTTTTTTRKPTTTRTTTTTSTSRTTTKNSRINSNSNRNRGSATYNQDRDVALPASNSRGTYPPRTRPTLKPSGNIVSKAQEFIDIYRYPPSRPEPIYPIPTPDKAAAKCRKDVCLLPDCFCGGKDIPGDLPVEQIPQIVLMTFDDSVNDLNKQLYIDLFEKGRVNPNGCPITATFYVSHEWTDYSQVQNLYADGHEMASHTISHSFGEQFSQKKWTREVAGQREILAAYGGVKLGDVRGMRAPFLSVGGNKMYKMLYDSNFTYDSSLPVYENRPPSWPYTFDYKIFHDCMIPPCPTRSYPGIWQVPMVMWQDLNGGRCSMGDACSNPGDADGVMKMIMKNFERHYTTNRAPFGLFYHAAWFTQPHHKEGFIKFLDAINAMPDVWIVTNWQALQWDRPKRCNNPKVCNLWHKSGVRYMKTCQPCPDIYPWTGKTGIRSSRIDNDIDETTT